MRSMRVVWTLLALACAFPAGALTGNEGMELPAEGALRMRVAVDSRDKWSVAGFNFLFGLREGFRHLGLLSPRAEKGMGVVLSGPARLEDSPNAPGCLDIRCDGSNGVKSVRFVLNAKNGRLVMDGTVAKEVDLGGCVVKPMGDGRGLDVVTPRGAFRVCGDRPGERVCLKVKDAGVWRTRQTIAVRNDPNRGELFVPDGVIGYDARTQSYREWKRATQLGRLTPPLPRVPHVNTPAYLGVRPGHDLVYRIPVTGESVELNVRGLPPGLTRHGRVLTGHVAEAGDHAIRIVAKNARGSDEKTLTLRVGETLALTPPMGWNSWNCFYGMVTDRNVRDTADRLVSTGLADLGYQYVNLDSWWQINNNEKAKDHPEVHGRARDERGRILPNSKFPDMKALTAYVHEKGLRCGIYSSPGPFSCGGCECSWRHEYLDAARFAEWGIDYLKYDWCSYANVIKHETESPEMFALPYRLMGQALRKQNRDIILAMCEYGMGSAWMWAGTTGASLWRSTGDVHDEWGCILNAMAVHREAWMYARPGAWNDPDMLVIKAEHGACGLTPNEQHAHLAFWCLQAAPLLIGCDLTKIDDFSFGLLSNRELIAIDQDALGAAAACVSSNATVEIWARPLADGSVAFGVFNPNAYDVRYDVDLPHELGLEGSWRLRDVWRQTDVGSVSDRFSLDLPAHMMYVYRAWSAGGGLTPTLTDIRNLSWQRELEKKRPLVPNDVRPNSGEPGTVLPKDFKYSP